MVCLFCLKNQGPRTGLNPCVFLPVSSGTRCSLHTNVFCTFLHQHPLQPVVSPTQVLPADAQPPLMAQSGNTVDALMHLSGHEAVK